MNYGHFSPAVFWHILLHISVVFSTINLLSIEEKWPSPFLVLSFAPSGEFTEEHKIKVIIEKSPFQEIKACVGYRVFQRT